MSAQTEVERNRTSGPAPENPYRPTKAVLEKVIEETPTIKSFLLRPETPIPFKTGQFMELALPGVGEAPFTPSSSPAASETVELSVMRVGMVTERLHGLSPGAELGLRGPFGDGYPVDDMAEKHPTALILGGGVGLAPLRSLFLHLTEGDGKGRFQRIVVCYGAKTPADLLYRGSFDGWSRLDGVEFHVTVDEGDASWTGNVGVVTTLLDKVQLDPAETAAAVCGPPIMMKFATLKLLEMGFPAEGIYLSMEKNMSCGIGKCGHCRLGPYYVCKDGPVFTYKQIEGLPAIWE